MVKSEAHPLVSIIVPVYNSAEYLEECIDSIVSQTITDWELLLIDDGSDDGSAALCDAYVSKDDRMICIHQDNKGPAAARNAGLDRARGKYIAMVDSDDVLLDKRYIEILLETATEADADISFCTLNSFRDDPPIITDGTSHSESIVTSGPDFCSRKYREYDGFFGCPFAKLAKAKLYKDLRFPEDIVFSEDNAVAHRLYYPCRRIALVSRPMYGYRIGKPGQSGSTDLGRKIDDLNKTFSDRAAYYTSLGREDLAVLSEKEMYHHMSYAIGLALRKTPRGFPLSEKYSNSEILESMDNKYGRSALYNLFGKEGSSRDSELFEAFRRQELHRSHVLFSIICDAPSGSSDENNKHFGDLTALFPVAYDQHVFLKLLESIQKRGLPLELDERWTERRDYLISRIFRMNSEVGGIIAFARSRSIPLTPLVCSSFSADLYSLAEDDARYFLTRPDHPITLGTYLESRGFASKTDGVFHIWESKNVGQIVLLDEGSFFTEDDSHLNMDTQDLSITLYRLLAQHGRLRFSHMADMYRIRNEAADETDDVDLYISLTQKLISGCSEDDLTEYELAMIRHILNH